MKNARSPYVSKWARKKPAPLTARAIDALDRATTGMGMNDHPIDAPQAPATISIDNFIGQQCSFAAIRRHATTPAFRALALLHDADTESKREDLFFELACGVAKIFEVGTDRTSQDWRNELAGNELTPALVGFLVASLDRYRASCMALPGEVRENLSPGKRRELMEGAFLLRNPQGRRRMTVREKQEILDAYWTKAATALPRSWHSDTTDITPKTLANASDRSFEAAFIAHYGRSPQTGDGDKNNVERIRQVLGYNFPLSQSVLSKFATGANVELWRPA